jgi:mono/diheme cytochrome c family protein
MKFKYIFVVILSGFLYLSCGGERGEKSIEEQRASNPYGLTDFEMVNGIGPIKEKITLAPINPVKVKMGEEIFNLKCAACHKIDERFVGPSQRYTADRRTPEYILNMMLNPDEMTKKHPTGQKMLAEYLAPMTNMNLKMEDAYLVLEYLRALAKEGHEKNIPAIPIYKNQQTETGNSQAAE